MTKTTLKPIILMTDMPASSGQQGRCLPLSVHTAAGWACRPDVETSIQLHPAVIFSHGFKYTNQQKT